jgi:tRNA (adenine22-N1)-methyltransferase
MRKALNPRLTSAAEFVRQGARFADVGTDHAYLPLFLLSEGRISYALCTDINEGPLASAVANAKDAGLYDKMDFRLTDGAAALAEYGITDMAICGMGGDLIASIVEAADYLRDEKINLILQPMTKQEHLRRHLALSGFSVLGERFSFDSGKYYVTLLAEYTGECREISECEAELGIDVPHNSDAAEYLGFLEGKRKAAKKALDGKRSGGYDTVEEEALLGMIDERISATKKI